jgi:hypothetical protein
LTERYTTAGEGQRHRHRWSGIIRAAKAGVDTAPFLGRQTYMKSSQQNQLSERDPADTPQLLYRHAKIELADFYQQHDQENSQGGREKPQE